MKKFQAKSLILTIVIAFALMFSLMFALTACGEDQTANNNQANNGQTNNGGSGDNGGNGGNGGGNANIELTEANVVGTYVITTVTYTPDADARADYRAVANPSATCTREQWFAGINDDDLFDIFEGCFEFVTVRANHTIHINGYGAENQAEWSIANGEFTYQSVINNDPATYTVAWDNGTILVTRVAPHECETTDHYAYTLDTSGSYVMTLERYNETLLTPDMFNGEWAVVSAKRTPDGDDTTYSCTRAQYFAIKGKLERTTEEEVLLNMFYDSDWTSYWFLNSPTSWSGRIYTEEPENYSDTANKWADWYLDADLNQLDGLIKTGWTNTSITYTSEGNIVITGTVVGESTIELTLQKIVAQA